MKTGKILKSFNAKDRRNVILRTPRMEDLDDLLDLINSLVDENAEILITRKFTREEEAEWLTNALLRLEKNEVFFLVAAVNGAVVASSDLQLQDESQECTGLIGIIVKNGYRDLGIGTEIMKTHFEKAVFFGLKVLTVNVFATNQRAIHVYEKAGFFQTERISQKHFRQGRFIDEVIMKKSIC